MYDSFTYIKAKQTQTGRASLKTLNLKSYWRGKNHFSLGTFLAFT